MKKFVFTLSLVTLVMMSCGKSKDYDKILEEQKMNAPQVESVEKPQETTPNGLALMQKSDCFACHKNDSKLIGPSYQEIANKYTAANADMLVTHIIDGSTGIWGEMQMTPHPGLSTADAKAMVDYILTLKTN